MSGDGETTIRAGESGDIAAVVDLWQRLDAREAIDTPEAVERLLEREPGSLLVAEAAGEIVGSVIATCDGWRGGFYRLTVDPAWRRRGVASRLVRAGERRLRALGVLRLAAIVDTERPGATDFWTGAGYEPQPEMLRFVRMLGAPIRAAAGSDSAAVVDLWTEVYFNEGEGGRATPYAEVDFDEAMAAGEMFVAGSPGEVVGVVVLVAPGAPGMAVASGEEAELRLLAVSAAARRDGIGRGLVDRCAELARQRGWPAIALWSRPYQTAAHRLYESCGYVRVPERDSVDQTGFARLVFRLVL